MDDDFILSSRLEYKNGYDGFLVTKVNNDYRAISEEEKKIYPEMLKIYCGKVQRIINSGILVSIPGYKLLGYVPKHHIKSYEIKQIENEVDLDSSVFVKITRIDYNKQRFQCSMKYCEQDNGIDLDANNVKWSVDFKTRSNIDDEKKKKINLDAIYNTICDRCGKTGHIKTECFNKGKSYELIPENMDVSNLKAANEKTYSQNLKHLLEDKKKKKKEKKKAKKVKKEKKEKKEKKVKKEKSHIKDK